jgi:hypothetical protein
MMEQTSLRANDVAQTHLAYAIAELYKRGYDARGKSLDEIHRTLRSVEADIQKAILQQSPESVDGAPPIARQERSDPEIVSRSDVADHLVSHQPSSSRFARWFAISEST